MGANYELLLVRELISVRMILTIGMIDVRLGTEPGIQP
jgi:hypothetical protein